MSNETLKDGAVKMLGLGVDNFRFTDKPNKGED